MSLPGVNVVVLDGNLNLLTGSPEQTPVLLGCCTGGTAATLYSVGDLTALQNSLDAGRLVELAAYVLQVSGGPLYVMPLNPSTAGAVATPTHTGTGSGSLAAAAAPHKAITVKITTGGALNVGAFTYQVGSGAVSAPQTLPSGGTFAVPGTYTTITFPSGTYVLNDQYVFGTDGSVTHTGSGLPSPTQASSPVDNYEVLVTITTAGANGTAQFTYSLDNGGSTSATIVTPSNGIYAIPGAGVVLTFSGTQTAGDTFYAKTVAPTFSNGDLSTALTALQTTYLQQATYSLVYVQGMPASASAAATQAATLETAMVALFNLGVYARAIMECPTVGSLSASGGNVVVDSADTDSTVQTAFQSVSAPHVGVAAGDELLTSAVSGLSLRRNAGWAAIARACSIEASRNIGDVGLGGVTGVTKLYRDEQQTPGLDAARFITLRTFPGEPGFYLTDGHTMALSTSDYAPLTNARVVDRACGVARKNALPLTNGKVETSRKIPGAISERAAQKIEARLKSAMDTALVDTSPQDAVATRATVNRTHNILADSKLIIGLAVQPFAYSKFIELDIGLAASV